MANLRDNKGQGKMADYLYKKSLGKKVKAHGEKESKGTKESKPKGNG